ncbi:pyridoxamine 5'-phosphate oxidase family protein [Poseidonocella sp. HB161398]|uniref:pyridoxamine 5'-phosphate oxidase family protein n=1 Tax=Poseidonocella sp. HB161398 TaxID=2320855 RepID=UPI0011090910|nr:pyridoxamine 5'-phosphate oxidase family protein [Poseidonocella sp. HB161398]
MSEFDRSPDGLAFSAAVQEIQRQRGSRRFYGTVEWPIDIPRDLEAFMAAQRSVFLATASAVGAPGLEHFGGPPGFLRLLGTRSLAMAVPPGDGPDETAAHLAENDRVVLLLIDYAQRRRVKIWGRGRLAECGPVPDGRTRAEGAERALLIEVEAWDDNCPRHIPRRCEAAEVQAELGRRDARIAALEAEIAARRGGRAPV